MSYSDQTTRRNPASIAAVVGVHLAIGYALISGLAYRFIPHVPIITVGQFVDDPPPPPPLKEMVVPKTNSPTRPTLNQPVPLPLPSEDPFIRIDVTPIPAPGGSGSGEPGPAFEPQPPRPSLARDAMPGSDRLNWITTDDYPAAALRQSITGTVAIAVTVGTNGRVQTCEVTASSGSQLLDDATCRLYTRRAHFTPARNAEGNAIAARRTDRFRWQIPD